MLIDESQTEKILWNDPELAAQAERCCGSMPGYLDAKRDYEAVANRIAQLSGFDLYDEFERCLFRYTEYEVQAYYLLGVGLRQELLSALA